MQAQVKLLRKESKAGRIPGLKYLEIISKGILSEPAKPEHSAGKLQQGQIVFGFLFVTDQKTSTFG